MKHDRIETNPAVMAGKPIVKGTRVPVEKILRELANGLTHEDILREYPRLSRDDINAVLAFAADYIQDWVTVYDHIASDDASLSR